MTFLEAMAIKDKIERHETLDAMIRERFPFTWDSQRRSWIKESEGVLYLIQENSGSWQTEGWTLKAENPKTRKRFKAGPYKTPEDIVQVFVNLARKEYEFLEKVLAGLC